MRRQRRNRSPRRRGLQNIGDVLTAVMSDLDHLETQDQGTVFTHENPATALPVPVPSSQETFAFYQTAEV